MNELHGLGTKTQSDVFESEEQQERPGEVLNACQSNLNVASQLPLEHTTKLERVNLGSSTQSHSTWNVDRFVEPGNQFGKMFERLKRFCQQIQNSISEIRSRNESLTSELQRNQAELKASLNRLLISECNRVANETSLFAQEQFRLSKQCMDETLRPQSQLFLAIHETIIAKLHEMSELLQNHFVTIQAWNGNVSELVNRLNQLGERTDEFVGGQQDFMNKFHHTWDAHCSRQNSFIKTLRDVIDKFMGEEKLTNEHISKSLDANSTRLSDWKAFQGDLVNQLRSNLSDSNQSAFKENEAFHSAAHDCQIQMNTACVNLKIEHDTLQSKLDTCLDRLSQHAASFSTDGLAIEFRDRVNLSKDHALLKQLSSQNQFDETIGTSRNGLNSLSQLIGELLLEIEKLTDVFSHKTGINDVPRSSSVQCNPQPAVNSRNYSLTKDATERRYSVYPEKTAQVTYAGGIRSVLRTLQLMLTSTSNEDSSQSPPQNNLLSSASSVDENDANVIVGGIVEAVNNQMPSCPDLSGGKPHKFKTNTDREENRKASNKP